MGLTVHYSLKSGLEDIGQVEQSVQQMRQLALDLPLEEVGEIVDLQGSQCDVEARRDELQHGDPESERLLWLLIQAGHHLPCPWNKRISRTIYPVRLIAFTTWPGPGCEVANLGLCSYPARIDWEYDPEDDQRFQTAPKGSSWHRFDSRKWERYCKKQFGSYRSSESRKEIRKVQTKLTGWQWRSFCKTQYASDPTCGGVPNFLRCHISVITLLDRIAQLPVLRVIVNDEGKYGPSNWQKANKTNVKPTYERHKGNYSPAALVKEVGEWNAMIAGFSGAMKDALAGSGIELEAPIMSFPDFERLEFKGQNLEYLEAFLRAMKALAGKAQSD